MRSTPARLVPCIGILVLSLLVPSTLQAQTAGTALSGTVTDSLGAPVPNALVSLRNTATGQSTGTQTDSSGHYEVQNLGAGSYEVSVSAEGFGTKVTKVTLTGDAHQAADVTLSPALSVQGLGFPPGQTQGSAEEQARLDRRTHMLKMHQRLGLITTAPLLATVIAGNFAGGRSTSSGTRDLHAALGSATAGLYFTTAYFAIRAPKISGTETRGPIRLHKALAWVHGPGMILTPILGVMAFRQESRGEKVHGFASAHGPVGYVTAAAYGAAILSVSIKF